MTNPRVTVPVEPEYTATDYLRLIAEGWEVIESTGSQMTIQNPEDDGPQDLVIDVDAMLSAAPAPDALRVAAKKLAFMARTSGGTPGPDRDLMSACDAVEAALQAEQKGGAA